MKSFISIKELKILIPNNTILLLDVRSIEEFNENHIPIAIHFPIENIEFRNFTLPSEKIIVTVCGTGGGRSERAAGYLKNKIKNTVYYLDGGTKGWFDYNNI